MDILAPLIASKETCVAMAAISANVLSTINTTLQGRHQKVSYTMWLVLWSKEKAEMVTI
jgi:hypothetical protein